MAENVAVGVGLGGVESAGSVGTEWGRLVTADPGTPAYYEQMAQAARVVSTAARRRQTGRDPTPEPTVIILPIPTPDAWFWSRADRIGDCWLWQGRNRGGYGVFERNKKAISAHRFAWSLVNGPIPDGMVICHRCDTPACINPAHLFVGTQAENIRDSVNKGRHGSLHQAGKRRGPYRRPPKAPKGERQKRSFVGELNPHAKLTRFQAEQIRQRRGTATAQALAAEFGVCKETVYGIWQGRFWRAQDAA